jgi:hypothetical protein
MIVANQFIPAMRAKPSLTDDDDTTFKIKRDFSVKMEFFGECRISEYDRENLA